MSNLAKTISDGLKGKNMGIPMDKAINHISRYVRGIKKKQLVVILGPAKSGKTTFCDFAYVLSLCKYYILNDLIAERLLSIVYYSFEIDRISKELEFSAHFIALEKPKANYVTLPSGVTYEGASRVIISSDYLASELISDQDELILADVKVIKYLMLTIYPKYIIPIFGEYDDDGKRIKEGIIDFIENRINPTGMYNDLRKKAEKEGKFIKEKYINNEGETKVKTVGYQPKDSSKLILVVTDHSRKFNTERGFSLKQTIDKALDYHVILRNLLGWTFIDIVHSNRNLADTERKKNPEFLYPTPDDSKDSSNFEEDCDLFWTTFNPNDDKYQIKKHFGTTIKDNRGKVLYPLLRTLHLVSARKVQFPMHFRLFMNGATKQYLKADIKDD
jgi:hypothetical protein